ncbi:hypothetical protein D9619_011622 [Psilocybe cf. subviscida]|uniref:Ferritin-like domain-containing protein n=1 Tax=Psilocybe cf. subviscida TaxID=2480587 RepID=A0A8H5BTF5_9AGAR|nr:hypothetical protein D9619_011622 [Psilocybe cf. subviscida]
MIFPTLLISALTLSSALAIPTIQLDRRAGTAGSDAGLSDITILNYALTLEHLENAFYSGALARFSAADFAKAGFADWVRARFVEIAAHEKTHVDFLTTALGSNATKACTYNFTYTDPKSFAALSEVLEGVGVSAYSGAAQFLDNPAFVTAAASILSTEARHVAWVASAINKVQPWSGAFDVPLGLNQVFTLAAGFIVSCPSTNPALPVMAFPALSLTGNVVPGQTVTVKSAGKQAPTHIAFFTGLNKEFVAVQGGKVKIPSDLSGQVYAVATTNGTDVSDATTVAGPAILQFQHDSKGNLITQ